MVIEGTQGVGKTNAAKVIGQMVTTYDKFPSYSLPCVVYLDSEAQFTYWTLQEDLPPKNRALCKKMGMGNPNVVIYKLSEDLAVADATMTMSAMDFVDLSFLCSSLEGKTEDRFIAKARAAFADLKHNNIPITFRAVREQMKKDLE